MFSIYLYFSEAQATLVTGTPFYYFSLGTTGKWRSTFVGSIPSLLSLQLWFGFAEQLRAGVSCLVLMQFQKLPHVELLGD